MIIKPTYQPVSRAAIDPIAAAGALPWSQRSVAATLREILGAECTLMLDERQQTDSGSSTLTAWADQSGAGNNLAQSTAGNRPALGQTINGYSAPDFDGTDDFVVGPAISGIISQTLGWHVFAVIRPDTHDAADGNFYDEDLLIGDASGYWGISLATSGVHAGHFDGSTKQTAYASISDNAVSLIEASWDATTISCRVNSGATQTVASGTPDVVTGLLRIGSRGAVGKLDGRVAFVAVCNRQLSASRANAIRAVLGSKYAVTA